MEKMSWLSRLNPRVAAGPRASRSASLQCPVMADPETCLMVFKNHWAQVLRILEKQGPHLASGAADDLSAVRNNTYQLVTLLAEERPRAEAAVGPILEFAVSEKVLERLLGWHMRREVPEERKVELLKLFETLISQAHQALLRQEAVVGPLLRLLALCTPPSSPVLEDSLVPLLSQLCVSVARDPPLLELFFHGPSGQAPPHLLLFSLLIPSVHHEGAVGQQARDALLLLMAVSAGSQNVARYIIEHSYFCPVLATGLSALYSSLPRKLEVRGDDWHFLRREDWTGLPSLALFMSSLEFCNAVIQVAHPLVQKQLVGYIHSGFLVPVMGPALYKTSIEEMIASTAYLDLFLRSVSEAALLKTFLRFLLLHQHDSGTILDTLVARIASNSRLCMVSLSLFRTLISLHCEDVLLQLVLRYLIPCSHVMLSQKRAVKELDLYGKAAAKFLSLIPRCCCPASLSTPEREEERAAWSKGQGSPSMDSYSVVTVPRPSTPSRMSFFTRQPSFGTEAPSPMPHSPGTPNGSPAHRPSHWEEVMELEGNYLEYLRDARLNIDHCVRSCRVWSAPYDGEEPNAGSLPLPPEASLTAKMSVPPRGGPPNPAPASPRTKKRGASLEGPPAGLPPSTAPPADTKDEQPLLNEADADAVIKKGRWCCPKGPVENGSALPPGPWEGASCLDLLKGEGLGQAPLENGGPLTIEEFHWELCQLQDEMANGGRAEEDLQPEPPAEPEPLSREEEEAYRCFSGSEGSAPAPSADPLSQVVSSPPWTAGQPPSQPFTGPFLGILLSKLENMLQNSLYVNFLLTGLLAQLACHPQPLLRSFLLNTNMVFQPSVKSLLQVLGLVKNKIEGFAASQDDFPSLLSKARKYLMARARPDGPDIANPLRRPEALVKSRKPTIGELIMRHTHSPTRARQAAQLALQHVREGQVLQALSGAALFRGYSAEKQSEALRVKNAVYCAVIFSEFLKELAAIAQAHAVTSPFLLESHPE